MIKYKKVYCTFFGYDVGDTIECEVCREYFNTDLTGLIRDAVDIHHLTPRAHSKCCNLNEIPNLIALCREHHIAAENSVDVNKKFRIIHLKNIIKKLENEY
tara:strand:- start:487 stop:789 length:303 start_codon:yes stop_codon:yes gene_type:complete